MAPLLDYTTFHERCTCRHLLCHLRRSFPWPNARMAGGTQGMGTNYRRGEVEGLSNWMALDLLLESVDICGTMMT